MAPRGLNTLQSTNDPHQVRMKSSLFHYVAACTILVEMAAAQWAYTGLEDPSHWHTQYPDCGGYYQSPIDIQLGYETHSAYPYWYYYNEMPDTMKLINNGHSIQLKGTVADGKSKPQLHIMTNTGVVGVYELNNVHFHWGETDLDGSEHSFLGKRYPLEMHAVHMRVINGQVVKPENYVVAAYLFRISTTRNPGLDQFLPYVSNVTTNGTEILIPPFPWNQILPQFSSNFFLYKGSVTSPPCPQSANFFIRGKLGLVTSDQLALFRTLINDEGDNMSGNWRPTQPLHGRNVYYVD